MTQTKKSRKRRKKGQVTGNSSNSMTQKRKTEVSENSVDSAECLSHKNQITTKDLCSLQIQRQISLNENYDMNSKEMYLNCLTEEEFDEKTESLLNLSFCKWKPYQKKLMIKVISSIKENGWFERFEYRDHQCAVELDDMGKWRIYVKPNCQDYLPFHSDSFEFDYHTSSSRFGLPKFDLGLWWYGDKIGLDDFIGLQLFSYISWERFFDKEKQKYIDKKDLQIIPKHYMKDLCKKLVDAVIDYQTTVEKDKKWKCDLCNIEYVNDEDAENRMNNHEEFHKVGNENVVTGKVQWRVLF